MTGAPLYFLDFETRSLADIQLGGRIYWLDPTTDIVCCSWSTPDGSERGTWLPGDDCPFPAGARLAAWNMMGFDRFGCDRLGWEYSDLVDLMHESYKAGLPGSIDQAAEFLLGIRKDKAGNAVTKALSLSPVKKDQYDKKTGELKTKGVPEALQEELRAYARACKKEGGWIDLPQAVLDRVVEYCESDVDLMVQLWPFLEEWLEVDADVSRVERVINSRGVPFDMKLARRLLEEDRRNCEEALAREGEALGIEPEELRTIVSSPQQFVEHTAAENAQADTVKKIAEDDSDSEAQCFARARQAIATMAAKKLKAAHRLEIDGYLYDVHKYFGGHTGRWSGQGVQLQNLNRPPKKYEDWGPKDVAKAAREVLAGGRADAGLINVLLRACIYAPPGQRLVVCDFSGVENRALAFYAGDKVALDGIARGRDPYKIAASGIFGVDYDDVGPTQRSAGKVAELACGYGGGHRALDKMAKTMKIDLAAAGVDAKEVVAGWRELHAPVVKFWYRVERAFAAAVKGKSTNVSGFEFVPDDDGQAVAIFLPSGRPIVYNSPQLHREGRRTTITYQGRREQGGWGTVYTYGGKLVENITQAVCRELMAEAMVRCEDDPQAPTPIMHVHDELVCLADEGRADEALAYLETDMTTLPDWAEGFPIGADGYVSERYKK